MDRVASTLRTVEEFCGGRLSSANAMEAIHGIAETPLASTWLFTLAAAVGAVGFSGALRRPASARCGAHIRKRRVGAILRRALARYSTNIFLQPFTAALVAGI